jgi:hypothetical protein
VSSYANEVFIEIVQHLLLIMLETLANFFNIYQPRPTTVYRQKMIPKTIKVIQTDTTLSRTENNTAKKLHKFAKSALLCTLLT